MWLAAGRSPWLQGHLWSGYCRLVQPRHFQLLLHGTSSIAVLTTRKGAEGTAGDQLSTPTGLPGSVQDIAASQGGWGPIKLYAEQVSLACFVFQHNWELFRSWTLCDLPATSNHLSTSPNSQTSSPRASTSSINSAWQGSESNDLLPDAASLLLELIDLRYRYDSLLQVKQKAAQPQHGPLDTTG